MRGCRGWGHAALVLHWNSEMSCYWGRLSAQTWISSRQLQQSSVPRGETEEMAELLKYDLFICAMQWESNYQRVILGTLPDPAICTFGCWNKQCYGGHVIIKGAYAVCCLNRNILHKDCGTGETWSILSCSYSPYSEAARYFQFGFQSQGLCQVHSTFQIQIIILYFYYIFHPLLPLWLWQRCRVKLRWILFSHSTWPLLLSGRRLEIQMVTYSESSLCVWGRLWELWETS